MEVIDIKTKEKNFHRRKVNPKVRENRLAELKKLIKEINEQNEKYKEKLYLELRRYQKEDNHTENEKNNFKENLHNTFMESFEDEITLILKRCQNWYKEKVGEKLDPEKLLYHADGKTLEERINKIILIDFPNDNDVTSRFNRLCLILDTESLHLLNEVRKKKFKVEYAVIEPAGDCDCCSNGYCAEYGDGEVYHLDELPDGPPFHPDCQCELILLEDTDVEYEDDRDLVDD